MELLDRYLHAVKFWLPKAQSQDILAELSEDIHSQIEEKETELGRKLNDSEVEAILKRLGRPVLVANRYAPQQYLIGPVLFPHLPVCAENRCVVLSGAVGSGVDRIHDLRSRLSRPPFRRELDWRVGRALGIPLAHRLFRVRRGYDRIRCSRKSPG